jgi:hypothetical protein
MNPSTTAIVEPHTEDSNRPDLPASWGETLLGLGPFLVLPAFFSLRNIMTIPTVATAVTLFIFAMLWVVLLVGWVKGFPRWVFPYWGFALLITLYFQGFTGTVFGNSFTGNWRVWIPLLGVAAIGMLWSRDLGSIYRLVRSFWVDWTRLSFAFYGLLPLMILAIYDEVHDSVASPAQTGLMLLLAVGALFYMRSDKIWSRFAWLVAGFSLAWALASIHLGLYWNGRQEPGMGASASWAGTFSWTVPMGAVLLVVLISPVLLEGLRLLVRAKRVPIQP